MTKVRLFLAAPSKGPEHAEYRITLTDPSDRKTNVTDTVMFERPETDDRHAGDDE